MYGKKSRPLYDAQGGQDGGQSEEIVYSDTDAHAQIAGCGRAPSTQHQGATEQSRCGGGYEQDVEALGVEVGVVDPPQANLADSLGDEDEQGQYQAASARLAVPTARHQNQRRHGHDHASQLPKRNRLAPQEHGGDHRHQDGESKGRQDGAHVCDLERPGHQRHREDEAATHDAADQNDLGTQNESLVEEMVREQQGGDDHIVDRHHDGRVTAAPLRPLEQLSESERGYDRYGEPEHVARTRHSQTPGACAVGGVCVRMCDERFKEA